MAHFAELDRTSFQHFCLKRHKNREIVDNTLQNWDTLRARTHQRERTTEGHEVVSVEIGTGVLFLVSCTLISLQRVTLWFYSVLPKTEQNANHALLKCSRGSFKIRHLIKHTVCNYYLFVLSGIVWYLLDYLSTHSEKKGGYWGWCRVFIFRKKNIYI